MGLRCWAGGPGGAGRGPRAAEESTFRRAFALVSADVLDRVLGAWLWTRAVHTQHDTAQAILSGGAGYVMTVKAHMPTLYRQLKKLPWTAIPAVSAVSTGHGRRTRRTIKAVLAPTWIGFAGAAQVVQLRRTVTRNGKKTVEVVYLITSDRGADQATLAAWVRGHWEIGNCFYWVRDVTYQEDKSLVRTGNSPRVMA